MLQTGKNELIVPTTPRMPRTPSDTSVQSLDNCRPISFQSTIKAANLYDPMHNHGQVWKLGFYIKIAQMVITISCIGCYTSGIDMMTFSINARAFPYVVYFTYLIINSVIILSYLMRQKMPELLIRIFGLLGGILFTVSWAVSLNIYVIFSEMPPELEDPRKMLLAQGILALFNAVLYYVDTVISYYKSLNGIFT